MIVFHGRLTGGSALTEFLAERHGKVCIHIDLDQMTLNEGAERIRQWIDDHQIKILNVAGPRARMDPKIDQATIDLLGKSIKADKK